MGPRHIIRRDWCGATLFFQTAICMLLRRWAFRRQLRKDFEQKLPSRISGEQFTRAFPEPADGWGLVVQRGMGDAYQACGLARSILRYHGGNSVTVYCRAKLAGIAGLFEGVSNVIVVPSKVDDCTLGSPTFLEVFCITLIFQIR